jgi:hypothetical protein
LEVVVVDPVQLVFLVPVVYSLATVVVKVVLAGLEEVQLVLAAAVAQADTLVMAVLEQQVPLVQ